MHLPFHILCCPVTHESEFATLDCATSCLATKPVVVECSVLKNRASGCAQCLQR